MIKSENYQALNTILPKFRERIQTIFIDPPFNKAESEQFLYIADYIDSSWLTLLENRLISKNDLDLFYTQGYLTAFHRLWQMEFQIKAAAGELSEIFGKRALKRDREQRRKGIIYAAKRTYNKSISDKSVPI